MGKVSLPVWQSMVNTFGEDAARDWAAKDGNEPPDDTSAQTPPPDAPGAETPPLPDEEAGLSVMQLQRDMIQRDQALAAQRERRLADATAALAKQRSGPTLSERLAQLSAAFAAPMRRPGFGGMMDNVMPVFAKQQTAVREDKTGTEAALRALREKYEDAGAASEGQTLDRRLKLAQIQDAIRKQDIARRKALLPSIKMDAMGGQHVVSSYEGIAKPQGEADLAKLPLGTQYIAWEGPLAGQIVTKLHP